MSHDQLEVVVATAVEEALRRRAAATHELRRRGPSPLRNEYELVSTHATTGHGFPLVVAIVIERAPSNEHATPARPASEGFGLTGREATVASLLREGSSNASIAATLSISAHTVKRHVERILTKLHVRSRAEAALVLNGVALPRRRT